MGILVGIDGGGAGGRAVAADTGGRFLSSAGSGGLNVQHLPPVEFTNRIHSLIDTLLLQLSLTHSDILHLTAGLAGAGRPEDREAVLSALSGIGLSGRRSVCTDMEIALEGAFPGEPGIVINAGTGSIVFGRNDKTETARAGGWGYLLGDEGSAYWIGLEALKSAVRSADGLAAETVLADSALSFFDAANLDAVVRAVYAGGITRESIASFAPVVFSSADAGDTDARGIIDRAAGHLSGQAASCLKKLGFTASAPACFTGSVLRGQPGFRKEIVERLGHSIREAEAAFSPAAGAVLIARKETGVPPDENFLETLKRTLPE